MNFRFIATCRFKSCPALTFTFSTVRTHHYKYTISLTISLIANLLTSLLLLHITHTLSRRFLTLNPTEFQLPEMASGGALRTAIVGLFILVISATAAAARDYAEFSLAPAPAPMEAGSAVPMTLSMVVVSASLLISLAGVIFH